MYLKPQDVVILLKLALEPNRAWTYNQLAYELRLSPSEVHKGIRRAAQARLFDVESRRPRLAALEEFLLHGFKYAYAPEVGEMTRGVPTAFASPGLREHFQGGEEAYVWPDPNGMERGMRLSPLYPAVPQAVQGDERLHRALGALDALRIGRVREARLAGEILREMLTGHGPDH